MIDRFEKAKMFEGRQDWEQALLIYEEIISEEPTATALFRAGLMLERTQQWKAAIERYSQAIDLRPDIAKWRYRLGYVAHRGKNNGLARSAFQCGIDLDFPGDALFQRILDVQLNHFISRLRIAEFLRPILDELRIRTTKRQKLTTPTPKIFMYWGQGEMGMPPVVKACTHQARRMFGNKLCLLDDASIPYYVDIPNSVREKLGDNRTALSDILRFALLSKYGGTWADATCYLMGRPETETNNIGSVFAFAYHGSRISSWYFADRAGGYVASMMYEALLMYWENHDKLIHYFILHHIFEVLTYIDETFAAEWAAAPVMSATPPHALQKAMFTSSAELELDNLLTTSPVHKLTYKFDLSKVRPDCLISELIRRDA